MWFSGVKETRGKDFQAQFVMSRDQGGLDNHMLQGTAAARNGPFPAKCSTVMRDPAVDAVGCAESGICCRFFRCAVAINRPESLRKVCCECTHGA